MMVRSGTFDLLIWAISSMLSVPRTGAAASAFARFSSSSAACPTSAPVPAPINPPTAAPVPGWRPLIAAPAKVADRSACQRPVFGIGERGQPLPAKATQIVRTSHCPRLTMLESSDGG